MALELKFIHSSPAIVIQLTCDATICLNSTMTAQSATKIGYSAAAAVVDSAADSSTAAAPPTNWHLLVELVVVLVPNLTSVSWSWSKLLHAWHT